MLESGAAASASVGVGERFKEMFEGPSLGNEVSKFRIIAADTGPVPGLDGGVTWELAPGPEGGE